MKIEECKLLLLKLFTSPKSVKKIKKKWQRKREKWGEYKPHDIQTAWELPRFVDLTSKRRGERDSRKYLEKLGFEIVGITCNCLYRVVVPSGYFREEKNTLSWMEVKDAEGSTLFTYIDRHESNESNCYIVMAK